MKNKKVITASKKTNKDASLDKFIKLILEQESTQKEAGVDTPDNPVSLREPKLKARPSADSVDDQIDALILRYESSSIRKSSSLNESLKNLNLRFLLEQDEEEAPPEEAEEAPPEEAEEAEEAPPADEESEEGDESEEDDMDDIDPSGSDDMSVTNPAKKQNIPDLDIDQFTTRVVRLANNYSNLLNIEESIINRAKKFLDENYGEKFVNEFLTTLSTNYGLETTEFNNVPDVKDDNFAVGAFAGGTGGLGGGG